MTREELKIANDAADNIYHAKEILIRADGNSDGMPFKIHIGQYGIPLVIKEDSKYHSDIVDMIKEFIYDNELTISSIGDCSKVSLNSCDNCRFIIRRGEDENDGCGGSHPVELAAGDFLCNRWEGMRDDT